jgi:hypothetical protein
MGTFSFSKHWKQLYWLRIFNSYFKHLLGEFIVFEFMGKRIIGLGNNNKSADEIIFQKNEILDYLNII